MGSNLQKPILCPTHKSAQKRTKTPSAPSQQTPNRERQRPVWPDLQQRQKTVAAREDPDG
jgi:hypothetical protein